MTVEGSPPPPPPPVSKAAGDQDPGDEAAQVAAGLDTRVEQTRAITGLMAVLLSDAAIAIAAIVGIVFVAKSTGGHASGQTSFAPQIVAILSSAFTAVGTLTTAYFGIKGIANVAGPGQGSLRPARQRARRAGNSGGSARSHP
jgi:hypothetical protein